MKHTKKFITLAVAAVMALGCASFVACDGDDPNINDGGSGIVADTSLQGKLFAAYTFNNETSRGAAINPFSGEALSSYDWTVSEDQEYTDTAKSGKAIVTGTSITMPWYKDLFDATADGFSFSYWSYGDSSMDEQLSIYPDWNDMITGEYENITYGNLETTYSAYPGSDNTNNSIGRGAYSDEMYAQAQDELTTAQLANMSGNSYAAFNAGMYEPGTSTQSSSLAAEMDGKAQYMTVVVSADDNTIKFYRNGALSYCYQAGDGALYLLLDVYDGDGGTSAKLKAFGGFAGYADDAIVGSALTDEEVLALYNDQMGASKTMADVTLKSNLNEDDANKATAEQEATADVTTQYKAKLAEALASEVSGGAVIADTSAEKGHVGIISLDNAWWTEIKEGIVVGASGAYMTGVLYNNLDDLAVTETLNCNIQVNGADYGATRGDTEAGWYGDFTIASTGYDSSMFAYDVSGSTVTITYTYDDANGLVVTYKYVPRLAGQTITGSASYTKSDGTTETVTKEYNVPDEIVITYTTAVTGVTSVTFGLISTKTYFMITDVSNMTL